MRWIGTRASALFLPKNASSRLALPETAPAREARWQKNVDWKPFGFAQDKRAPGKITES
jgi:hypothetical protein